MDMNTENEFYNYNPKEVLFAVLATSAFISSIYLASVYSKPWPVPEGYYTLGASCKRDSDCKCSLVHGEFDSCGKSGTYPACVNGACGWDKLQTETEIDLKIFQQKKPGE
ncbi:hypothetical protein L0Y69_02915 [bacterium]|nr:hypothetical protein [bacterium]